MSGRSQRREPTKPIMKCRDTDVLRGAPRCDPLTTYPKRTNPFFPLPTQFDPRHGHHTRLIDLRIGYRGIATAARWAQFDAHGRTEMHRLPDLQHLEVCLLQGLQSSHCLSQAGVTGLDGRGGTLGVGSIRAGMGKKCPLSIPNWRENWAELATFYRYPLEMRRVMYTTNIIEGYHRQLRKATKGKSIFPNDEALTKMLYLATMEVTRKWTMRVANWGQIVGQPPIYFEERLAPHLTR